MTEGSWQQSEEYQNAQPLDMQISQISTAELATEPDQSRSYTSRIKALRKQLLLPLQESVTEVVPTSALQASQSRNSLGMIPILALTNASGLLMISCSYYLSVLRYGNNVLESLFLSGLLLMFVPNFLRLLSPKPTRLERISLLLMLGICFYFVYFMTSPQHVSWYDEFLHWRTVNDILRSGHLFSENPMLPASPYYSGLEIVTDAISTMTGLSAFYAGIVVILTARVVITFSLFLLYEHITNSSRMAGIALLIYMANPHFLLFDSLFSYETLALPLATFLFYILVRFQNADKDHRWIIATAWIVLIAVSLTHHMTDYVSIALLLLWAGVSLFVPTARHTRIHLIAIALFGLAFAVAYAFLLPGNPVWSYLSEYFGGAFAELAHIITGTGSIRPLFSSAGQVSPIWDRLLMIASVGIVTCCIPFGLLCLIRKHRHNAFAVVLGLFALLYPVTQAFRFTEFGAEITDRAAAFLFLPIAYVLILLLTYFWLPPIHNTNKSFRRTITFLLSASGHDTARFLRPRTTVLITSALAVIFLGSVIVASGANLSALPGPYIVGADTRSIEPEGIEAATWSLTALGPGNHMAADRINQMLMSTYGGQRMITDLDDQVDISPLFLSSQLGTAEVGIIHYAQIRYVVVDLRLSTALPLNGFYFESDQPKSPIQKDALTKFNTIPQINRIFDSGNIVIYDTRALING
jgi:hypothetical protein